MQRHVYRAVVILGLLCLVAAASARMQIQCADAATGGPTAAGGAGATSLEGTWRVKVTVPPSPDAPDGHVFDARLTFSRGGGLVESDTNPATPDGGAAHGVWVKTDSNTFGITFERFAFNPITQQPGVFKVTERIHVNGNTYTGESPAAYFCDADGSGCILLGPATSVGSRMEVELP